MKSFWAYDGETHSRTSILHFLAVTEIDILEDAGPGTVIYRAAAKDPEDAVFEVIYGLGQGLSVPGGFMCVCVHKESHGDNQINYAHNSGSKHNFCLNYEDISGENERRLGCLSNFFPSGAFHCVQAGPA